MGCSCKKNISNVKQVVKNSSVSMNGRSNSSKQRIIRRIIK